MKLELLGWKCEGLRCPDFSFDLKRNKNSKAAFVQMPNGIPVATVAIGKAQNAGLLAVRMLSMTNDGLAEKLSSYHHSMAEASRKKTDNLK